MKKFSEKLHKKSQSVKLQASEKRELRERLVSYMEYHPLPAELKSAQVSKKAAPKKIMTDAFTTVSVPFSNLFKYSAAAAAFVLVLVPFMAEKSVPGDTLYAVKVHLNEEVVSTLTFGSYEKVEWETQRLNRRISEARLLASEGRLTKDVEAEVAEAVKTHTENAKREIEELRTQDADTATIAAIELDTTLEVQSAALRGEAVGTEENPESTPVEAVDLIANAIDESLSDEGEIEESAATPAYEKLMARVEENTTRIFELRESLQTAAEVDQLADVTRRIEDVERAVQSAITLAETDSEEASNQLVGALQSTQKLIVYMTEIEVKQTLDIETLVPVVLTPDEEMTVSEDLQGELAEKLAEIDTLAGKVSDESVLEKVALGNEMIVDLKTELSSSTNNFESFKVRAQEAIELSDDLIILLEQNLDETIILPEEEQEETSSTTESFIEEEEVEVESKVEEVEELETEEIEGEPEDEIEPVIEEEVIEETPEGELEVGLPVEEEVEVVEVN